MLLAKLDQNTLQVEAYDHRLRLPSKWEKSSTDVAARPSYPPLHAYKSTRVRTREIRIDESNGVRKEEEHGCEPLEAPTSDLPYLFALDFLELDLRSFAIPVFRVVATLWAAVRGDPLLEPALSSERLESGNRSAARGKEPGREHHLS